MRISDWSSDVCSSDRFAGFEQHLFAHAYAQQRLGAGGAHDGFAQARFVQGTHAIGHGALSGKHDTVGRVDVGGARSEEHTSELQSLMRISYAVFCLKKKNKP